MRFKQYKQGKAILRASLREIEAGHWCQCKMATSELEGEKFDNEFIPADAPMGCALGLISTYGGHGKWGIVVLDDKKYESFRPDYPSESEDEDFEENPTLTAPEGVLKALDALYRALPRPGNLEEFKDDPRSLVDAQENAVWRHNDLSGMDRLDAGVWFRKALELV